MTHLAAPRGSALAAPVPGPPPAPRRFGPNWYATVMGTAITATGTAVMPGGYAWLHWAGVAVWALSCAMLAGVLAARAGHWLLHADQARREVTDPTVAPFYGCLAMALLAVGSATLTVGASVIGGGAAARADAALWAAGTVTGLAVAVGMPYLMIVRHEAPAGSAAPAWLLPIVPPMVSAATGPPLVAHLAAGQPREALVYGCYAMFGMSLLMTLVILPVVFGRLVHTGALPVAAAPTLLFVLGPLGQSATATGRIADASRGVLAPPLAHAATFFSVLYGVPVMGFAMLWLALSLVLVGRAVRDGMRFSMTWWAFVFPVGTCVTGAASLAAHTGAHAATWLSVGLFALLAAGWAAAFGGTAAGLFSGRLPAAPGR